jgi:hypothetical protein
VSEVVVRESWGSRRGRLIWRLVVAFGYLLATVAVVALVVGALALRDAADEQRTQTTCQQASAYAAYLSTPKVSVSKKDLDSLFGVTLKCEFP